MSTISIDSLAPEDQELVANVRADLEELRQDADPSVPPPSFDDDFLVRLVLAGSAYAKLPRKFLADCGFILRAPDQLDDSELHQELWRAVWALALLRLVLDHTDHLSERQLYEYLWEVVLDDPATFKPGDPHASIYLCDVLGGYALEDIRCLLTYYSDRLDDDARKDLLAGLEDPPQPSPRPYDRDRMLP